jgi:endoglucanase
MTLEYPLLLAGTLPLLACGPLVTDVEDESAAADGVVVPIAPGEPREPTPSRRCSAATVMISDGEQSQNQTNVVDGRGGYWYTYADRQGTSITPIQGADGGSFAMTPGGANGTAHAARMTGTVAAADIVYAGMGMNFVDPKGAYDAQRYQGLAFFAKKGTLESTSHVRFEVPDRSTDPDGNVCSECFNDFGAALELTTDWQLFAFPFSKLTQQSDWGSPRPASIDPDALYGIQFQVIDRGKPFDLWVDEIQFTGCR